MKGDYNYIWSDPDYLGDDSITVWEGTYQSYLNQEYDSTYYGRYKGVHNLDEYTKGAFSRYKEKLI